MAHIFNLIFSLALLLIMINPATAEEYFYEYGYEKKVEYGVAKHTVIPHNLDTKNQFGEDVNFETMSGENGMVLYFVRSVEWCAFCKQQMIDLSRRGSMIEDTDYDIVVVTHDSVEKVKRFTEQYDFPYDILSDKDSEIIKAFGLFNSVYLPGTAYYGISHPAMYIIGNDGFIIDKYFDADFKNLLYVEDVREMLNDIGDYEPVSDSQLSKNLNP
jgi:peroxiredoxin